jgi:hypothetical protein
MSASTPSGRGAGTAMAGAGCGRLPRAGADPFGVFERPAPNSSPASPLRAAAPRVRYLANTSVSASSTVACRTWALSKAAKPNV